ncbi:MAG: alpha-galactosidase, partial [Candidatus Aminicenantes bacterium]|nr:alpha-galactosidase [Candidatus Aminicenantes bacterium]
MNILKFIRLLAIFYILFVFSKATATASTAPPNKPAEISINGTSISLVYESTPILQGQILASGKNYKINRVIDKKDGRVTQLLTFTTLRPQDSIEIQGKIFSGQESFPCEADRRDHGLTIVRHSSGPSHSRLNRAVYDRARDWVLSIDHNPSVRITPLLDSASSRTYAVKITGSEIVIRFRPRYYQKHRGLKYFEPWTYRIWPKPIVGWCSWFAYFSSITEENIKETADVLSEVLLPYGYDYLQIDDGYQRGQGLPELWLKPNMKFPNGLKHLVKYIKDKGLKPGVWTNVAFNQMDFAKKNKNLFVLDKKGYPAQGNWVDISIDGSNPEAINRLVRPIYRGLKDMGWDYFKVD